MAEVAYIDPDDIPESAGVRRTEIFQAARDHLREALRLNKAIQVDIPARERSGTWIANYRRAAAALRIGVHIRTDEPRPYTNQRGESVSEPSVLYVRITKAAPIKVAPQPITIPASSFEPTLLPGVEVSR